MKKDERIMVPTENLDTIESTIHYTMDKKCISILSGKNGYGKTSGIKYTLRDIPNSFYISISQNERASQFYYRFLQEIAEVSKFSPFVKTNQRYIGDLLLKVIHIIQQQRNVNIIVIDEFGNLNSKYISTPRGIWDNINQYCGIVLAGPPSVVTDLEKWRIDGRRGINELMSRVGKRIFKLSEYDRSEIEQICRSRNITLKKHFNYLHKEATDLRVLHSMIDDYEEGIISFD